MTKTMLGSPIYMAPEILNGQIYSNKADIWSIGVVLYEMLYGYCPFESNSIPKLIEVLKETELDFPHDVPVSNETKKLLRRILTKDPQKRVEWMELFQMKISSDGRLMVDDAASKLSLNNNQDIDIMKGVREVSDISDELSSSSSSSRGSLQGYNNFTSPRNVNQADITNRSQKSDDKPKLPFGRKAQTSVEDADPVQNSPMRRIRTNANGNIKDMTVKFHQEIVRGINIARSMGLNNEKYTPLFSFIIFKSISEKLKKFREE